MPILALYMPYACLMHASSMPHPCLMHALCMPHPCLMQALCMPHPCLMHALGVPYTCPMHALCVSHPCLIHAATRRTTRARSRPLSRPTRLRLVFLKAKITGYISLSKNFERICDWSENEGAASAPLFPKKTKTTKTQPLRGYRSSNLVLKHSYRSFSPGENQA